LVSEVRKGCARGEGVRFDADRVEEHIPTMKLIRYRRNGIVHFGIVEGGEVYTLEHDVSGESIPGTWIASLEEVELLAPVRPTKIVALGKNYRAHAAEMGSDVPLEPLIFLKPPSAVIGPKEPILLPEISERVDYEGELAVVIGRRARHVSREEALNYVLGYTCANDVTARDLQRRDEQWTRAKGFDTFCPLGPWIVTDVDPGQLTVETRVNGEVRQRGNTRDLVFDVPDLIAHISQIMTLEPGDVIMTGTPAGVGPLHPGDVVEVEIEGIGVLRNPVQRERIEG